MNDKTIVHTHKRPSDEDALLVFNRMLDILCEGDHEKEYGPVIFSIDSSLNPYLLTKILLLFRDCACG